MLNARWSLFALLLISVWINYMDRGNLGVAAPILAPDLGIAPDQLGLLLSAFFFTYAFLQPVAGWLVDRFDVYRVYAAGFAVWSLAMAAGGLTTSFAALFASRLVLGIGESVAYPAYSRILASEFPERRRGLANALIDFASKSGSGLGTLIGGLAVARFGWRAFFLAMGLISMLWLIPWLRSAPRSEMHAARSPGVPASELLAEPRAWMTFLGLFGYNYAFYFLLNWLPSYLVTERRFSMDEMAVAGALPYAATVVASLICGVMADRMIHKGADPGRVRRRFAVTGLGIAGAALLFVPLTGIRMALAMLILTFLGGGIFSSNGWAITQRLAGPRASGTWTGFQNAIANLGGIAASLLTGWLAARYGNYFWPFVASSAALLMGAASYALIRSAEPVAWREATSS